MVFPQWATQGVALLPVRPQAVEWLCTASSSDFKMPKKNGVFVEAL